jgi:hypothetical protein
MTTPQSTTQTRSLLVNGEGLRVEGIEAPRTTGGPKFEPRTAEAARELLIPQIEVALAAVDDLPAALRAPDRLYLEARLLPNYLAASYFPDVLLTQIGATSVGSRADTGLYVTKSKQQKAQTRRLILAVNRHGLAELQNLVYSGGLNRTEKQAFSEIRKIDEFAVPRLDSVLRAPSRRPQSNGTPTLWEAVLHPAATLAGEPVPLDYETLDRWIELVRTNEGHVYESYIRRVGGLTFVPVRASEPAIGQLIRFNPLRALRPMPIIRPRPGFGLRSVRRVAPPAVAQPVSVAPTVAVFDGGVEGGASALFPVTAVDLTFEVAQPSALSHGTGVTAAVLYGLLKPGQQAPQPPLPVSSYRVVPGPDPDDLDGYRILDQILSLVQQEGHRIVNLSLGVEYAVEDDMEPHRWTSALDQLAWDNDVLFVVAPGNHGDADQVAGLHRVEVPADMVNGLTVGACDAASPQRPWSRAPYSSMGPGRHGNRIQPVGVQFGGADHNPIRVMTADGRLAETTGTSYAAPVTTHALAELTTRLPRVNASVLRAFATHFAERHSSHVKLRDQVGHGRHPLSFDDAMECRSNEVHVLFIDEIVRGDLMAYRLPVPDPVGADVKLRMTLAYATPVDPPQATEYTSASLEMLLRPHHRLHNFRPPAGVDDKPITADIGSSQAAGLLAAGWEPSQEPITKNLGAPPRSGEARLRDSGKWETIRHHRVTLKSAETAAPRLELSYVARRAGALDNAPTRVPFALLVTVIDTNKSSTLYDTVRQQFSALRPASRARVRVRGHQSSATWY